MSSSPSIPALPNNGQEVYDLLMSRIEPDLVTATIPLLDEKYKNETPEQKALRKQRYNTAFATYDAEYTSFVAELKSQVSAYRASTAALRRSSVNDDDNSALQKLETSLSSHA